MGRVVVGGEGALGVSALMPSLLPALATFCVMFNVEQNLKPFFAFAERPTSA
jgi:hypothetical protein